MVVGVSCGTVRVTWVPASVGTTGAVGCDWLGVSCGDGEGYVGSCLRRNDGGGRRNDGGGRRNDGGGRRNDGGGRRNDGGGRRNDGGGVNPLLCSGRAGAGTMGE